MINKKTTLYIISVIFLYETKEEKKNNKPLNYVPVFYLLHLKLLFFFFFENNL